MHCSARFALLLSILLLSISVWGQQTQPGTAPPPAPKDPQAVTLLNQALAVAGETTSIAALTDYTAKGNITYNWNPQAQGSVTVQALGLNQYRVDASLPKGVRSSAVTNGQMTMKFEDGSVQLIHTQIAMNLSGLVVPYLELSIGLNSPAFSLSNKGLVEVNGHSAYDIQVQLVGSGLNRPRNLADFYVRDYFVDATTFHVLMTQDLAPKHVIRQLQYSDFTPVNGVLVPFSITEMTGSQQTWTMQLSQITFNSGLQDSAFALQ
jgi:hypothetical protein